MHYAYPKHYIHIQYTHTYIYIHTYIHTYINIQSQSRSDRRASNHSSHFCMYIHIHTHTEIHSYTHTYIHTYIHKHTEPVKKRSESSKPFLSFWRQRVWMKSKHLICTYVRIHHACTYPSCFCFSAAIFIHTRSTHTYTHAYLHTCTNDVRSQPFAREWGVFAIRNLCEENLANQEVTPNMHVQNISCIVCICMLCRCIHT